MVRAAQKEPSAAVRGQREGRLIRGIVCVKLMYITRYERVRGMYTLYMPYIYTLLYLVCLESTAGVHTQYKNTGCENYPAVHKNTLFCRRYRNTLAGE